MNAHDLVGDPEEFLFLAEDDAVVRHDPAMVWDAVEADRHDALLTALSPRYAGRHLLVELPDGYRCTTSIKAPFRRARTYDSVVWLDPPDRSVELQRGRRTDLRYELSYCGVDGGTRITCTQWYRAHTARFGSGTAIAQLQRRATEVVATRIAAIRELLPD